MFKSYNILPKKSIFLAVTGLFIFFAVLPIFAAAPDDPDYSRQEAVWRQIGAENAWDIATGTEAVVAVIDIGVDYEHPDLKDNIWINADEIPANNIDDDNNGFIDDIHGWNFVEGNAYPNVKPGSGFGDNTTLSHGTAIAGLIGAVGDNGLGIAGLNWRVKIMPIRAIDSYGVGDYKKIGQAIAYAANNGASAISVSFIGDVYDTDVRSALKDAYNLGVVTAVAAGNSRRGGTGDLDLEPLYPVCFDNEEEDNWLIGVTSVDNEDRLSGFANYGSCVDLTAPGEGIYSTEMAVRSNNYSGYGGGWQGTSFAAPFVAGTVAALKGIRPDWTAPELIETVLSSADNIDSLNPYFSGRIGYGRLNAGRAVAKAAESRYIASNDRMCYLKLSRIYCYDISSRANTYLADAGGKVMNINWLGKSYLSALVAGESKNKVVIYTGNGIVYKSWQINSKFSRMSLFEKGGTLRLVVAGFDTKTNRTEFIQYGASGNILSDFNTNGNWRFIKALNDRIYTSTISDGKAILAVFNLAGKKLYEMTGPPAIAIAAFDAGHVWPGNNYEVALIAKDGAGYYRYVADIENKAFVKERLMNGANKLILMDKNSDGVQDLLIYNLLGGNFEIVTGKGKNLGSVYLPAL